MKNLHKVNVDKTVSSTSDADNREISYCGYSFNLNTKEIKASHRFEKAHKFATGLGCGMLDVNFTPGSKFVSAIIIYW